MMTTAETYHTPVLLRESIDGLDIKPDGVYVDVTFGGGGHSREILRRLGKKVIFTVSTRTRMQNRTSWTTSVSPS